MCCIALLLVVSSAVFSMTRSLSHSLSFSACVSYVQTLTGKTITLEVSLSALGLLAGLSLVCQTSAQLALACLMRSLLVLVLGTNSEGPCTAANCAG